MRRAILAGLGLPAGFPPNTTISNTVPTGAWSNIGQVSGYTLYQQITGAGPTGPVYATVAVPLDSTSYQAASAAVAATNMNTSLPNATTNTSFYGQVFNGAPAMTNAASPAPPPMQPPATPPPAVQAPAPVAVVVSSPAPSPAAPPAVQTNTTGQPVYTPPAVVTPTIAAVTPSYAGSGTTGSTGGSGYVLASDLYGTTATPDGTTSTPTTDMATGTTAPAISSSPFSGVITIPGIGNVPAPVVYGSVAILAWLLLRKRK